MIFVIETDDEVAGLETVEPDTPQMREIAGKIKALINQIGWDASEKILVGALDLELVSERNGQGDRLARIYTAQHPNNSIRCLL